MVVLQVLLAIYILLFQYGEGGSRLDPLVLTKVGMIRGLKASDGDYSMFLGIPYAKVDAANPFGLSTVYPDFDPEFKAFNDSKSCPQYNSNTDKIIGESADCLTLNVFVPISASYRNRLPVMVFIHGGNFEYASSAREEYGPKFLVRHGVILVTINHRVGLYGYMCLHTRQIPGNQGLKDQLAALRWINNNIEAFGGDVNKITVFGESSGGRSVDFHVISKQEQLFQNAILQSGTSLTRDTFYDPDYMAPIKLAQKLGRTTKYLEEALKYLATVNPLDAVAAALELNLITKPCIEKEFDGVESFITDYTINLDIPKAKNINFMVGFNQMEQVARYADKAPEYFDTLNIIYDRLHQYFDFNIYELNHWTKYIHCFYLGEAKISVDTMWEIIDFDSFFSYAHPAQRIMDMYLKNGAENVYYYIFSYNGTRNFYKSMKNVTVGKAGHADELGYLFDIPMMYSAEPPSDDQHVIDQITTLWTNFAKYGNPTPVETELLPVIWKRVTKDARFYLDIDKKLSLGKRPWHAQTAFWDLFFEINWSRQRGYKGKKQNSTITASKASTAGHRPHLRVGV